MLLLAAGGVVLATGALGLVRLAPESGLGSVDVAEAAPGRDSESASGRATLPGRGGGASGVPRVSPSFPPAVLGAGASPLPDGDTPAPDTASTAPGGSTTPSAPRVSGGPTAHPAPETTTAPAPTGSAPRPPATSGPPVSSPTPRTPPEPDRTGLCVPVIGVCVDLRLGDW